MTEFSEKAKRVAMALGGSADPNRCVKAMVDLIDERARAVAEQVLQEYAGTADPKTRIQDELRDELLQRNLEIAAGRTENDRLRRDRDALKARLAAMRKQFAISSTQREKELDARVAELEAQEDQWRFSCDVWKENIRRWQAYAKRLEAAIRDLVSNVPWDSEMGNTAVKNASAEVERGPGGEQFADAAAHDRVHEHNRCSTNVSKDACEEAAATASEPDRDFVDGNPPKDERRNAQPVSQAKVELEALRQRLEHTDASVVLAEQRESGQSVGHPDVGRHIDDVLTEKAGSSYVSEVHDDGVEKLKVLQSKLAHLERKSEHFNKEAVAAGHFPLHNGPDGPVHADDKQVGWRMGPDDQVWRCNRCGREQNSDDKSYCCVEEAELVTTIRHAPGRQLDADAAVLDATTNGPRAGGLVEAAKEHWQERGGNALIQGSERPTPPTVHDLETDEPEESPPTNVPRTAEFGTLADLTLGLYRIYWKSGGVSLAAVGQTENGDRWLAPTNWVMPSARREAWSDVERVELIAKRGDLAGGERPEPEAAYPCDKCRKLRTEAEGGTTFTVCDACWDTEHPRSEVAVPDKPTARGFEEAKMRALEEPTLLDALAWIAVWECERAIKQAKRNEFAGWDACFKYCFQAVMTAWEKLTKEKSNG